MALCPNFPGGGALHHQFRMWEKKNIRFGKEKMQTTWTLCQWIKKDVASEYVCATGVIKDPIDFAVFCIARTYMRLLHTHVVIYATVCARTVRIMHGWGGGWAWLHALSWHTCWMLRNCTYMFHATQLHLHTHTHMLTAIFGELCKQR